ncbi:MAG: hypothetical protein ABH856_00450 [Patescibacteria group bacterium]|nr:hypothetical protein [Patescibacteria group bacterium]
MPDLESFFGADQGGEGMSEEDFERFKEHMRAATAQLKALQKSEQKQKKGEQKLIKILLKFLKTSKRQDILLLTSRVLEQNVPANFVLSLIILGNEDMQKDAGMDLKMLPSGKKFDEADQIEQASALTLFGTDEKVLSMKAKIEIDNWIKNMYAQAEEHPYKVTRTVLDFEDQVKLIVEQLASFILRDFLLDHNLPAKYERLKEFVSLVLGKMMEDTKDKIRGTRELEEGD